MIESFPRSFMQIGHQRDGQEVVAREFFVGIDGKSYSLEVGTHDYIKRRMIVNQGREPELRDDAPVFLLPFVADLSKVIAALNEIPEDHLSGYLEEIPEQDSSL